MTHETPVTGTIRRALESGIPQQLINRAGDVATSIVQGGSQNPVYGLLTVVVAAAALQKAGIISKEEKITLDLAAAAYAGSEVISDFIPFAGGGSTAVSFDIPDVRAGKLEPRTIDAQRFKAAGPPQREPSRSPEAVPEAIIEPGPILEKKDRPITNKQLAAAAVAVAAAGAGVSAGAGRGRGGARGVGGRQELAGPA